LKKIAYIFGTRPEAVKLCPLILLTKDRSDLQANVCVTAQHREMLDQVLEVFGVIPDVDLDLMQHNQTLPQLTATAITAISAYLDGHRPDLVVVQGDTTTTFCAGLAAFYHQIPVAHVEAGLRTWNKAAPYPEEINRSLTTRVADYHFAPTEGAKANLLREGVLEDSIFVTGNTVVDALHIALHKARQQTSIPGLPLELMNGHLSKSLVLITSHRRENFGPGFRSICQAIRLLAEQFSDTAFVYPVHLNPNVRGPVFELLSGIENVFLLEPLGYLDFVALLDRSKFVLTDSGGIQEEAPSLNKPVLLMRSTTERPEGVAMGIATLVGTEVDQIVNAAGKLLSNDDRSSESRVMANPFGDGKACQRILEVISSKLMTESKKS
jgi:UDP-N-acetylglucosamine 2-epimerase (non-hydrolysing)